VGEGDNIFNMTATINRPSGVPDTQIPAVIGINTPTSSLPADFFSKRGIATIAGLQAVENGLPTPFIREALGASTIHGVIRDFYRFVKKGWHRLSPGPFRLGFRIFSRHRGVGDHENVNRVVLELGTKMKGMKIMIKNNCFIVLASDKM
jgi:hypothetical protein